MQIFIGETKPPKFVNNSMYYALRTGLAIAFYLQAMVMAQNIYHLLPYTEQGIGIVQAVDSATMISMIFGFVPLIMAGIFLLIYHFYAKYCTNSIYRVMQVFGSEFDVNYARTSLDIVFIVFTILYTINSFIFMLYPLGISVGLPIAKGIIKLVHIACIMLVWTHKQEKIYKPVVVANLMFPSIIMIVLL